MNILDYPLSFATPRRLTHTSFWRQHIPFAMFLVQLLEPEIVVELGTHYGDSYCAFCQAVSEIGLNTACYAVDTWQGDPHVGDYKSDVIEDLRSHHDKLYSSFSTLVQSTFDEALSHFGDGTIDLLHIDGYHTYEAVLHDFECWKPKLSSKGVVLFHDINVRERDFGVWKLWQEVKEEYPYFEFFHGHGLGLLAVGKEQRPAFREWLKETREHAMAMRSFFFSLGERLDLLLRKAEFEEGERPLREELKGKDQQVAHLRAENARLRAFYDAVRATWAYRVYRLFLVPFKSGY